jgi:hypothetical protein
MARAFASPRGRAVGEGVFPEEPHSERPPHPRFGFACACRVPCTASALARSFAAPQPEGGNKLTARGRSNRGDDGAGLRLPCTATRPSPRPRGEAKARAIIAPVASSAGREFIPDRRAGINSRPADEATGAMMARAFASPRGRGEGRAVFLFKEHSEAVAVGEGVFPEEPHSERPPHPRFGQGTRQAQAKPKRG